MTINKLYERERALMIDALPQGLAALVVEGSSLMIKIDAMCKNIATEAAAITEVSARHGVSKTALHDTVTDMCISTGMDYQAALASLSDRMESGESLSYLSGLYNVGKLTYKGLL